MKAMQELVVGWESAIETLKQTSDAKLSDLMYSIHTAFLEALSIGIFPQVPFDYSKFILSMKSFFSDPRLKEVVTDISASFELNLVVRDYVKLTFFNGKEGVELLEQIEKEDDFTGTILDLANRHIVSQFRQTDIDYLFVIKTLNRWASNKDFLKALFEGRDFSWFDETEKHLEEPEIENLIVELNSYFESQQLEQLTISRSSLLNTIRNTAKSIALPYRAEATIGSFNPLLQVFQLLLEILSRIEETKNRS